MSNLRIGKAEHFYTLWQVDKQVNEQLGYTQYHCIYHQNLSLDLDKAIEKSKEFGCTNFDIDDSLRGQSRTFSYKVEKPLRPEDFKFGQYKGQSILECNDIGYLEWFCKEVGSKLAKERLSFISPNHNLIDGDIITNDRLKEINEEKSYIDELRNIAKDCLNTSLTFISNINSDSEIKLDTGYRIPYVGDAVERSFRGFEYWLPTENGRTGKKIKNKEFQCRLTLDEDGMPVIDKIYF